MNLKDIVVGRFHFLDCGGEHGADVVVPLGVGYFRCIGIHEQGNTRVTEDPFTKFLNVAIARLHYPTLTWVPDVVTADRLKETGLGDWRP